jgi:hypothetical protein
MLVQKSIAYSVHSMDISPDGTKLVFGTLEGHVGIIDEHLSAFTINTTAHGLTVNYMYYTYPGYYVSIGDDTVAILWNDGTYVSNFTSLLNTRMFSCSLNNLYAPFEPAKYMVCFTNVSYTFTYRITNTSITRMTSHGPPAKIPQYWVDSRWLSPDEQSFAYHYANGVTHDVLYNALTNTCSIYFGRDKALNVCRFCGYMLDNCQLCSDSSNCTQCASGAYLSGALCHKCP